MRYYSLAVGALSVAIVCASFSVAKAEEDKSYLPPSSYQGKAEPSPTRDMRSSGRRTASAQPVKTYGPAVQPQRRRVAAYRRHRSHERYAYNQPSFFRTFFPFTWFR